MTAKKPDVQAKCPHCGYCEHCGRSNHQKFVPYPYPVYPYIQRPYGTYRPPYQVTWTTNAGSNAISNQTGGSFGVSQ